MIEEKVLKFFEKFTHLDIVDPLTLLDITRIYFSSEKSPWEMPL